MQWLPPVADAVGGPGQSLYSAQLQWPGISIPGWFVVGLALFSVSFR